MKLKLGIGDVWAVADTAAKVLALSRIQPGQSAEERARNDFIRFPAVKTLRMLWRRADLAERRLIAARIHIWLQTRRSHDFGRATNLGGVTR